MRSVTPIKIRVPASQAISPGHLPLPNPVDTSGIYLIGIRNQKNNIIIPSSKNYIGTSIDIQVRHCKIDSGCSSLLLPLDVGDLDRLRRMFPVYPAENSQGKSFLWSVQTVKTPF